jgi:lysozyme
MRASSSWVLLLPLLASCAGPAGGIGEINQAVCSPMIGPAGVDVSEYQGTVDWPTVAGDTVDQEPVGFAIARVSDGSGHLDPDFAANWSGIQSAGLVRGVYQFFEPGADPTLQANLLVQNVGMLGAGDLPAIADVEVTGGQSAATIAANLSTWLDIVQAGTGKTPMIYTSPGWWDSHVGSSAFGAYPLWVANWDVCSPSLPIGWSSFQFFQYDDAGNTLGHAQVPGIGATVDLDEFNGDAMALTQFAGQTASAYAAQFVSQTWPYATTSFTMVAGQVIQANIVLKNVGTATWDSNTLLATTQPRDRASPFSDASWVSGNRLAAVQGSVPPGGTFEFDFDFHAPTSPGSYDEFYGVVEDGVAWFSDPGQGGPPDNQIEAKIDVSAAPPMADAAAPPSDGAAPDLDGAESGDASSALPDAGGRNASGGRADGASQGCSCEIGARARSRLLWPVPAILLLLGRRIGRRRIACSSSRM